MFCTSAFATTTTTTSTTTSDAGSLKHRTEIRRSVPYTIYELDYIFIVVQLYMEEQWQRRSSLNATKLLWILIYVN